MKCSEQYSWQRHLLPTCLQLLEQSLLDIRFCGKDGGLKSEASPVGAAS